MLIKFVCTETTSKLPTRYKHTKPLEKLNICTTSHRFFCTSQIKKQTIRLGCKAPSVFVFSVWNLLFLPECSAGTRVYKQTIVFCTSLSEHMIKSLDWELWKQIKVLQSSTQQRKIFYFSTVAVKESVCRLLRLSGHFHHLDQHKTKFRHFSVKFCWKKDSRHKFRRSPESIAGRINQSESFKV